MARGKIIGVCLSVTLGLASWALAEVVDSLEWLPYFVLPISAGLSLLFGALMFFDWLRANRRESLPGFGVHMLIRIADLNERRRRYIFSLGKDIASGGSFYLSASDRFVFTVRDAQGEPYSLEIQNGWLGLPIAKEAYFALEAGTDGVRTVLRALLNGRIVGERWLPFRIDFGQPSASDLTLGANRDREHGAFSLGAFALMNCTLDKKDSRGMLAGMSSRGWRTSVGGAPKSNNQSRPYRRDDGRRRAYSLAPGSARRCLRHSLLASFPRRRG